MILRIFHRPGRPNLRNARRAYLCTLSAFLLGDALTFRAARVENGNWHEFGIKGASLPPKRTLPPSSKGTTRFLSIYVKRLWFFPLQSVWILAILIFHENGLIEYFDIVILLLIHRFWLYLCLNLKALYFVWFRITRNWKGRNSVS